MGRIGKCSLFRLHGMAGSHWALADGLWQAWKHRAGEEDRQVGGCSRTGWVLVRRTDRQWWDCGRHRRECVLRLASCVRDGTWC